jgi:hypothetical protein
MANKKHIYWDNFINLASYEVSDPNNLDAVIKAFQILIRDFEININPRKIHFQKKRRFFRILYYTPLMQIISIVKFKQREIFNFMASSRK